MNNAPDIWTFDLFVPTAGVTVAQGALAPFTDAVSAFEVEGTDLWHVTGYTSAEPDSAGANAAVAVAMAAMGQGVPTIKVDRLEDRNWLAENRRAFPPVDAGRFFVRSLLDDTSPPIGRTVITLEAGPAFGSGTHETTRGCLLALDSMARKHRFKAPLDLGSGSGILAIAIAKTWPVPVLATDIDLVAVATARENAVSNGVATRIRAYCGAGLDALPMNIGDFDLIVANILARPLAELAPGLARRLAPGGRLVLSGLLGDQETMVLAPYRAQGLYLSDRFVLGDWPTLVLARK